MFNEHIFYINFNDTQTPQIIYETIMNELQYKFRKIKKNIYILHYNYFILLGNNILYNINYK